jgi:hypothetical protein
MLPETADTALKLEQPIMHHLLQHFRQNFWHLVEQQMASQDTSRREGAELEQYSNYSTEQSNMYEVSSVSRLTPHDVHQATPLCFFFLLPGDYFSTRRESGTVLNFCVQA